MRYFTSVVNFFDRNILLMLIAVLVAIVVEFVIFLVRKIKDRDDFDYNNFYVCIVSDIIVLLGIYILSCLLVGLVNCIKDQDWKLYTNYKNFVTNHTLAKVIFVIVFIVSTCIWLGVMSPDEDTWFWKLLGALLAAGVTTLVSVVVGFLLYAVVAVLWILLKVIWFVVSGFFISIFQFVVKYWRWTLLIILTPGVVYGAVRAFINYIQSLKDEVYYN